jgi:hypothetical protein
MLCGLCRVTNDSPVFVSRYLCFIQKLYKSHLSLTHTSLWEDLKLVLQLASPVLLGFDGRRRLPGHP